MGGLTSTDSTVSHRLAFVPIPHLLCLSYVDGPPSTPFFFCSPFFFHFLRGSGSPEWEDTAQLLGCSNTEQEIIGAVAPLTSSPWVAVRAEGEVLVVRV